MPANRLQQMLHYLRTATVETGAPAGASDADLLARYASVRDESAFELLVWRHGGMVLGVCRRLLRHEHDAQDAFQATFLALARRAHALGQCASVGAWLHQVAYRAALRIRTRARQNARALPLENAPLLSTGPDPCAEAGGQELWRVLEEQISRLPYPYRAVVVLRCLAGKSSAEAARELGCAVGAVESRLVRARQRLRAALGRKGFVVPAGLLAVGWTAPTLLANVSPALVCSTGQAATFFAAGKTVVAGAMPTRAAALAEGVLKAMFLTKLKNAALGLLVAGCLVLAGGVAYQTQAANPAPDPQDVGPQKGGKGDLGDKKEKPSMQDQGAIAQVEEVGLVLIDLRQQELAKVGDLWYVYRREPRPEYLGQVKLLSVKGARAVAKVVSERGRMQVGDRVAAKLLPAEGEAKPAQQPKKVVAPAGVKSLWAALSVNRPVFRQGETETLQLFFTLVNDGHQVVDPKVGTSRIIVNGKALADANFILSNGPRDARFESLPAGDHLLFGYALGKQFERPGVYRVYWEGEGFRSPEIVFRVLPK